MNLKKSSPTPHFFIFLSSFPSPNLCLNFKVPVSLKDLEQYGYL